MNTDKKAIIVSHDESLRLLVEIILKRLGYTFQSYQMMEDVTDVEEETVFFHVSSRSFSAVTMQEAKDTFPQAKFIFLRQSPDGTEPGVVLKLPFTPYDLQQALRELDS
jgi:Tfp pilus assembly protein PilO